jgi:uncharacterized protein
MHLGSSHLGTRGLVVPRREYVMAHKPTHIGPVSRGRWRTTLFGKVRRNFVARGAEPRALKEEVSVLRASLGECQAVVRHWSTMRLSVIAIIAAVSLAVGFTLGAYKEPIGHSMTQGARLLGLARLDSRSAYRAYQRGRYTTALQLAQPLAEQGDARAQLVLGLMYGKGQGVPQAHDEAVKWYRLAADQNEAQAQYELAFLYATGDGVAQDYVAAHMWFNLAGANLPASDVRRRYAIANREALETKMTREQIAEAQTRARDCKPK